MPAPANLVHEQSSSTGTSDVTVSAISGKQRFANAFSTGGTNVFDYFISNRDASEYERGTGHMFDANTLVRDLVIESTNSNNRVNFSAGTKDITNDIPAGNQARLDNPATTSQAGVVSELATAAEMQTGTDTSRVPPVSAVRNGTGAGWSSFSAHKNGTDQTGVADSTFTVVTFSTEVYDVGSNFASNTWTPPAGKVTLKCQYYATGTIATGTICSVAIYKNSSLFKIGLWFSGANQVSGFLSIDDIANGTDTYDMRVFIDTSDGSTSTIEGDSTHTYFMGHMIN